MSDAMSMPSPLFDHLYKTTVTEVLNEIIESEIVRAHAMKACLRPEGWCTLIAEECMIKLTTHLVDTISKHLTPALMPDETGALCLTQWVVYGEDINKIFTEIIESLKT